MTREEKERIQQKLHRAADAHLNAYGGNLYYEGVARGLEQAAGIVGKTKCVDAVEVVRCEDCKHRPTFRNDDDGNRYVEGPRHPETLKNGHTFMFEDGTCPCVNEWDSYFSYVPKDDWFCANGERRETNGSD